MGFPALVPDQDGDAVAVHLSRSIDLPAHRARFDDRRRIVRAVLTSRSVRARGLSSASSFRHTGPAPGDWTAPLADAVVAAGWPWRPVITFLQRNGG